MRLNVWLAGTTRSLLCVMVGCAVASAEEEPISTDRPDFVESSEVVGRGVYQIETGGSLERDTRDGNLVRTYTTPTLLRIGLAERLEARIETDGRTITNVKTPAGSETIRGYSDVSLGAKWRFASSGGAGGNPGVAGLLHVDINSGSRDFRGTGLRPSLRAAIEWDLPKEMSLGLMPGVVYDNNERGRFVSGVLALTSGQQWTPALRSFVEVAGQQIAHAADGGCLVTYDVGATYLVTNDVQLDVAAFRGANDNTPRWSLGGGLSIRF